MKNVQHGHKLAARTAKERAREKKRSVDQATEGEDESARAERRRGASYSLALHDGWCEREETWEGE